MGRRPAFDFADRRLRLVLVRSHMPIVVRLGNLAVRFDRLPVLLRTPARPPIAVLVQALVDFDLCAGIS